MSHLKEDDSLQCNDSVKIKTKEYIKNYMKKFGPDTSPNKYKGYQKEICDYFGLVATNTVHIAVGNKQDWSYFQRDGSYNRVNIAKPINDLYKKKFYKHIEDKINGKT